jgi:hypothetical protein
MMRILSVAALASTAALTFVPPASANDLESGWNKFESGVERGFYGAKAAVGRAADDIEDAADDGATWIKEKFDDDRKVERRDGQPPANAK